MSFPRLFSFGAILLSVVALYSIKLTVKDMQDQIADLDNHIAQHQESVHVLQAEIAYLTRPERLSSLQHLYFPDMIPMNAHQMTAWLPVAAKQRSAPTLLASSSSFTRVAE